MPVSVKGRCYCLADVNALYGYGRCYSQEVDGIPLLFEWQMLLSFFCFGRYFICYSILQLLYWLMLLPCGRWYHRMFLYCFKVLADVIAMWQMEKPLYWCFIYVMTDVIAQWQMK